MTKMTRRPRVALLVTAEVTAIAFYPGYPEFLRSRGWDVAVIADSRGALESSAVLRGADVRSVAMRRDPAPLDDLRSLIQMFGTLRSISPDVVVFATPKASLLASIAGLMLRVPVRSYQLWGLRLETERGMRRKILLWLEKLTSLLATDVVANSRSLAALAVQLGTTAGRPVSVIGAGSGLGVDLEHFSRSASIPALDGPTLELLEDSAGLTIGFVGRVHPDKGIGTLILAARALAQERDGVRLLIVGDQDGAELDQLLQNAGPTLDVHVLGGVSDVRPYYQVMDVHCLPTLREGFPNVVLEASAMGIPTITTDATGAIDSVLDGKTGYIFPVGDVGALTNILLKLYDAPALRVRLGASARQFVEEYYDRPTLWDLHERHIRSLLQVATRGVRRSQKRD